MDIELEEQAERARRQQAFVNALLAEPQHSTVHQLAHRISCEVVNVRNDTCKYAENAPDAHVLHWRAKRCQARAYMDAQCWYQGAAALMHQTLTANCWDGLGAGLLRTLTAHLENANPGMGTSHECEMQPGHAGML